MFRYIRFYISGINVIVDNDNQSTTNLCGSNLY